MNALMSGEALEKEEDGVVGEGEGEHGVGSSQAAGPQQPVSDAHMNGIFDDESTEEGSSGRPPLGEAREVTSSPDANGAIMGHPEEQEEEQGEEQEEEQEQEGGGGGRGGGRR